MAVKKDKLPLIILTVLLIALPLLLIGIKQTMDNRSRAASPDQLETEGGVLAGNATTKQDSQASGGSYVELGVNSGFSITSGPTPSNLTDTGVTITWYLSDYGSGQIEYGTTTSYGQTSAFQTCCTFDHHIMTLSGLSSGTTYHYRVRSTNQGGTETVSPDNTFTTTGGSGPTPTNGPTPTPGGSGGGMVGYGTWFMNGIGNLRIWQGTVASYRFRATENSTITSVRWYDVYDVNGYSAGNGGKNRITLRNDDGTSNHYPSNTVLASVPDYTNNGVSNAGKLSTFTTPYTVTAGKLYHIVFENAAADTIANNFSIDLNVNESYSTPRKISELDFDALFFNDGVWENNIAGTGPHAHFSPIMDVSYGNGKHQGNLWYEAGSVSTISGGNWVRERFTVSGGTRTINEVDIAVSRGSGTSPLIVALEDSNNNVIEQVSVPYSNFTNGMSRALPTKTVTVRFPSSHTLQNGQTYNLRYSTASDTTYGTMDIKRGDYGYGYDPSIGFPEGTAQKSSNSGGSWSTLSADFQFVFFN